MQPFAPLRFYESLESQNDNRPWTKEKYVEGTDLIMSRRNFTPFVLKKALNNSNTPVSALIYWADSPTYYHNLFSLISGDFQTVHDTDTNERWHVFKGLGTIAWPSPEIAMVHGLGVQMTSMENFFKHPLYLVITDGTETWYSETFRMYDFDEYSLSVCNYLKVEWTGTCRVGDLPYHLASFGLRAFFDADLGRPNYTYEDEVEEDGKKNRYFIFQRAEKRTKLEVSVPEYLADALSLIPLHNIVIVTDRFGSSFPIVESEFSAAWETDGAECDATLDLLLNKTIKSCC